MIRIIEYDDRHAEETITMWRASKERALGVKEARDFDHHLNFLRTKLVQENVVHLAIDETTGSVVGIMAINGSQLNQLYIHIDYQRQGIGTRLLDLAKQLSPAKLHLYTFAVNTGARAFYERHGFTIIGRGDENEEGLPDLCYQWISERSKMPPIEK